MKMVKNEGILMEGKVRRDETRQEDGENGENGENWT